MMFISPLSVCLLTLIMVCCEHIVQCRWC